MENNELTSRKKQLFNNSLDILSNTTTKNPNSIIERRMYRDRFISHLKGFYAKSVDRIIVMKELDQKLRAVAFCENTPRITILNKKDLKNNIAPKKFKFDFNIFIDDLVNPNYYTNEQILVHEMNHADTYINTVGKNTGFYTGFVKLPGGLGEELNESINELYTQVAFFRAHPEFYTNINSIDDILYKPVLPEYTNPELFRARIYQNLGLVAKLLVIASDNDMSVSYDALERNNDNFFNKKVFLNDRKYHKKNDLIYCGKYNGEEFEKQFDFITEEGKFEELLESFGIFFTELKNSNNNTTVGYYRNTVSSIIKQIDEYKENKYSMYYQKGIWNKNQLYYNESRYNEYKKYLCSIFDLDYKVNKLLTLHCKEGK